VIRPARPDEVPALQLVEARAASRFGDIGLPAIAALPVTERAILAEGIRDGRVFVSVDSDDVVVGFAIVEIVGDAVHLREIDVVPEAISNGRGTALIEHVAAWARARGAARVTLTTFRDVPWNAPYYARRGFRVLDEPLPPHLARQRQLEREHGIDMAPRVAMSRELV
jgi:GNAT superfamily N-acetyltransferase